MNGDSAVKALDSKVRTNKDRFEELSTVRPEDPDPCWPWLGGIDEDGYGKFRLGKVSDYPAHRMSYELYIGPILKDKHIDHTCHQRFCVRPSHLEAVPQRVNTLRGNSPSAMNYRKTHCCHGHEFTEENTYFYGPNNRHRRCKQCVTDKQSSPEYVANRRKARGVEKPRSGENLKGKVGAKRKNTPRAIEYLNLPSMDLLNSTKEFLKHKRYIERKQNFQGEAKWRTQVLCRCHHKCVKCGCKENLHTHHVKGFMAHPELRTDPNKIGRAHV